MKCGDLRHFIGYAPVSMAMFDGNMRYLAASPRWMKDFRLDCDIVGRSHYDLFPETPEHWKEVHRRVLAGEVVTEPGERFERADGSVYWLRWQVCPWKNENDEIGGIVIFSEDFTERRIAEEDLRRSAERLRLVQSAARIGVWDWDIRSDTGTVHEHAGALFGWPEGKTLTVADYMSLVPEEERAEVAAALQAGLEGRPIATEHRMVNARDGSVHFVSCRGSIEFDENGVPVRGVGAVFDITERRQAEEETQKIAERLALAQSAAQIGIWDWNLVTGETHLNDQYYDLYGFPRGARMTFEDYMSTVHPEDREALRANIGAALATGGRIDTEVRIVRADDGAVRWHASKGEVNVDDDGRPVRVMGIVSDITERRNAEEALRRSEAEARRQRDELDWIYQTAPVGLCFFDLDLRYRRINRRLAEINDISVEAHIGQTVREVVPALAPKIEEIAGRVKATGEPVKNEAMVGEIKSMPGVIRYWEVSYYPARDESGALVGFSAVVEEITERRNAEEALRRSEVEARHQRDRLDWIYQNAPVGMCLLDLDLRYQRVNRTLAECNGLTVEAHIGRTVDEIVPSLAPQIRSLLSEILATGKPILNREISAEDPAGSGAVRYWNESWYPARDVEGAIVGFSALVEEITESKHILALREADRRKDEFLATLAHELRNPLMPIRNAIQLLKILDGDDAAARQKRDAALTRAERQVDHLMRLVDDLLEVTRISHGKIVLKKERVDLTAILTLALDLSLPQIQTASHHLTVDFPPEPLMVEGDTVRLAQVFANLLNNAAKFTDPGGRIDVVARAEGVEAIVTVRDNGIGVAPNMLTSIFELFTQVDFRSVKAGGGIGIGLALSRKLVQLHDGRVEAHSRGVGCGSEFVVRLPLAADAGIENGNHE